MLDLKKVSEFFNRERGPATEPLEKPKRIAREIFLPPKEPTTMPAPAPTKTKKIRQKFWANLFILAIILAAVVWGGWRIFGPNNSKEKNFPNEQWYAVKLVSDETYFGQIGDVAADPVILKNVYYDYEQAKTGTQTNNQDTGNIKLVKRGNETYGPSGTMNIVRSQVLFMEPLKPDSKVLTAILDYEKKK